MGEYLIDLDELVLRCKDDETRGYIAEAVACYKGGAFRACIVTTWIAVVYDFVYKLRQLELTGDKNAVMKLEEFEKARKSKTPELALNFEKKILEWARDEFEFLSPLQHDDLERLLVDRNRCAHPSMISAEEIYQPPAELARYHLRNAITHMLQHPPMQGQAALERLKNDTLSEYFPIETTKALEYFKHGPLANPKPALIRNFVIALAKILLTEEHDEARWKRFIAALSAVRQMHRMVTENTFSEQLSKIMRKLADSELSRAVKFLSNLSDTWSHLEGDIRTRVENYILNMSENDAEVILYLALDIPDIKPLVLKRLETIAAITMQSLVRVRPRREFVQRGIVLYGESENFYMANDMAMNVIIPLINHLTSEQIEQLIKLASENNQVSNSYGFTDVLKELNNHNLIEQPHLKTLLDQYGFDDEFQEQIFSNPVDDSLDDIPF